MQLLQVTDAQWAKMLEFLRACPDVYVGAQWKCRQFLAAVLWTTRCGAQWRLLPAAYGNCNSGYQRFARWREKNVFESFFACCANDPDLESLLTDSTVVRAHACAAGAKKTWRPGVRTQQRRLYQQAASEGRRLGTGGALPAHRGTGERYRTRPHPSFLVRLSHRR